ncbi:MAG: FHA domain-containing protein [Chloroflexi bacterium]|nr:MAG: FHA domain-containing protein [Chloroflexota bacterium]MBL1194663.1 FHA domain-containing protein [Chloroflexota bacterium]NOH11954.1 FHA domain-containing protein [Chloroflexota bacterium]
MTESAPNANSNFPETAFLVVDTQVFPIRQHTVNIGRNLDNHVVIQEATVSRVHAQIRYEDEQFSIHDLNSTGGTYVNGKPVAKSELNSGDSVMIASVPALFVMNTPQLTKRALAVTGPLDNAVLGERPTGR